jgi:hypothetical protein
MTSSLARFAGPIAITAAALVISTRVVSVFNVPVDGEALKAYVVGTTHAVTSVASIVAFAVLILALVALDGRRAGAASALGAVGLGAAVIGTVFMAGDWWYEAFSVPWMADIAPSAFDTGPAGRLLVGGLASFALFAIGWALYASASIRAGTYPIAISVTILVGGITSGLPFGSTYLYGNIVLGLGIGWLGLWVMRTRSATVAAALPA